MTDVTDLAWAIHHIDSTGWTESQCSIQSDVNWFPKGRWAIERKYEWKRREFSDILFSHKFECSPIKNRLNNISNHWTSLIKLLQILSRLFLVVAVGYPTLPCSGFQWPCLQKPNSWPGKPQTGLLVHIAEALIGSNPNATKPKQCGLRSSLDWVGLSWGWCRLTCSPTLHNVLRVSLGFVLLV